MTGKVKASRGGVRWFGGIVIEEEKREKREEEGVDL
jgi:hypothetical protein